MKNLIMPAAGKSSRYPDMKPKWLLTHPDGQLMIEKVLHGVGYQKFDRTIIVILKEHCDKYDADIILNQLFKNSVDIVVLPEPTESVVDTVYQTIERGNVVGSIVVKDSDCYVKYDIPKNNNYIAGLEIQAHTDIEKIQQKSFIVKNEDDIVIDIVEKSIVSNIVCVGVYSMDVDEFIHARREIIESPIFKKGNELYMSHIISYLIIENKKPFEYIKAKEYIDWGTKSEWIKEQNKYKTFVFDIDGVFLENHGKYGKKTWENTFDPIWENIILLKKLSDNGNEIIFMTARPQEHVEQFKAFLQENEIKYKTIICQCYHGKRIIVNDFSSTNPYPSCEAISIPRNDLLKKYI